MNDSCRSIADGHSHGAKQASRSTGRDAYFLDEGPRLRRGEASTSASAGASERAEPRSVRSRLDEEQRPALTPAARSLSISKQQAVRLVFTLNPTVLG